MAERRARPPGRKAAKKAKMSLQRARQDFDLEAGDGDADAADLQELRESVDKANEGRRAAEGTEIQSHRHLAEQTPWPREQKNRASR